MIEVVGQEIPFFHEAGDVAHAPALPGGAAVGGHAFDAFEKEADTDELIALLLGLFPLVKGDDVPRQEEIGVDVRDLQGLVAGGQELGKGDQAFDGVGEQAQVGVFFFA